MTAGTISNDARYWVSSARVDVLPSGTSVSVRYRLLEQELGAGAEAYRNGRESIDVTLAQEIPIPILRALGSRWQALFSVAMGSRQDGIAEPETEPSDGRRPLALVLTRRRFFGFRFNFRGTERRFWSRDGR